MYKGIRSPVTRTPRTIAEDKGTNPAGFAGASTPESLGMIVQYKDAALAAKPTSFPPRGGSEKPSW